MNKAKNQERNGSNYIKNEPFRDYGAQSSYDEFKYDEVTNNIYKKLGKEKQFCDYPQKIPHSTPRTYKLRHEMPDMKRLKSNRRTSKTWDNDADDAKFLDKIVSLKGFQKDD